ncbi:MAG TPA: response regulator transcription factor [Cellvibrio sp.]|nr:response regulator transcription factor [Cellvibrio sp.]
MTGASPVHILLIEDDTSLAEWILDYLHSHGYKTSHISRGDQALAAIKTLQPDLIVLDVMLPYKNGFDICKELRLFSHSPVLMLTACSEESDEILGLELGASDYLAKPVKPRLLLARIKALLRRDSAAAPVTTSLQFGQLKIVQETQTVFLQGEPINLTSNEFAVLWLLASHAGKVVSREHLVTQLRGIEYDGLDRSIDIRISRLRKKLQDNVAQPFRIKTIWAKGYLFAADAWQ